MKKKTNHLWASLALLCLSGCGAVPDIQVKAQRATFEAIAPEYLRYVEADPSLSAEQKARRAKTVQFWGERIQALEARAGGAK